MLQSDDIISFAESILYGSERKWGKSWTQMEIDGFFYNHFLNSDLQVALTGIRELLFAGIPFPCQWNSLDAANLLVSPWGDKGNLGQVYQDLFPAGPGPLTAQSKAIPYADNLHQRFCLPQEYLQCAIVHGTPVPFERLQAYQRYGIPHSYRILIYGLPVPDYDWIKRDYDKFRSSMKRMLNTGLGHDGLGSNITSEFFQEGPTRLEIRSDPPYATSKGFIEEVQEAVAQYKNELGGRSSLEPTIRTWCVYLLAEKSRLSNRDAIQQWNRRLGDQRGWSYNFDGPGATSNGEIQFSRDKRELVTRINHYKSTLPR